MLDQVLIIKADEIKKEKKAEAIRLKNLKKIDDFR
jgi:hypothetical protein